MEVPFQLIEKYGGPAPRYTSYPPANHFAPLPDLEARLRDYFSVHPNNEALSVYLHVPFCSKLCFFCGCNMQVSHDQSLIGRYVDHMLGEIALWRQLIGGRAKVSEIHFGGGTPSELPKAQMDKILAALGAAFEVLPDSRMSIEIDPRYLASEAEAQRFVDQGFNRISLGVQDFNEKVQKTVNRIQPLEKTFQSYQWFKSRGMQSINIDLIYGLPFQTHESFSQTLREVLRLDPDRIALFQFAYLPKLKKHHSLLPVIAMPGPQARLDLFNMALRVFSDAGYVYLGMDHFAKQGDPLTQAAAEKRMGRNFQGYHEGHSPHMISVGVSAIGVLPGMYFQNGKDVLSYGVAISEGRLPLERGLVMSADDQIRRRVIERLMCDFALDFAWVSQRCGQAASDYFAAEIEELKPMAADGLLQITAQGIDVTPLGKHFIRYIAKGFDTYARQGKMSPHHMQAV